MGVTGSIRQAVTRSKFRLPRLESVTPVPERRLVRVSRSALGGIGRGYRGRLFDNGQICHVHRGLASWPPHSGAATHARWLQAKRKRATR
jgi:hypothetical protein